jgi:hypothetical protein
MYVDIAFCTINFAAFWPEICDFNLNKDFFLIRKMAQIHDLSRKKHHKIEKREKK